MKNKLLVSLLVSLAAASGVFAQSRAQSADDKTGHDYTLQIESEMKLLARGYAEAFGSLQRPISLTLERGEKLFLLEDVRGVRAVGSVLVIEVGRGVNYLVNPRDIVAITDGFALKQIPEPKPAAAGGAAAPAK